jgi:hypothetical protein
MGAYANLFMNGGEVFKFAVRAVPTVSHSTVCPTTCTTCTTCTGLPGLNMQPVGGCCVAAHGGAWPR